MEEIMVRVDKVSKKYKLGQIGGTTLRDELQRGIAKMRHKDDPTKPIGAKEYNIGDSFFALKDVSFEVKKGERIGIIGHNGAGKSTLLKLLSRVTAPTEGSIGLNGRITSMLEVGTGFHAELTGRENIYMNGAILGMTRREIDEKIDQIIEFSECRKFIDTPVKRYSSGMYVKLAFAVAAHLNSEIMIMDEVLAVGDMAFHKKCINKMNEVSLHEGRTILYVSHSMNTIRQLCNRVIVLSHGSIIYDGNTEEGIAIYMGGDQERLCSKVLLDGVKRPSSFHGEKIHLTEFRLIDKQLAIFEENETMRFSISFNANEDICKLQLYFVFKTSDDIIIGMSQTGCGFANVRRNQKYSADFQMSLCGLCEGIYKFAVDIFSSDDNGNHLSYDHPLKDVLIKIVKNRQDGSLIWNTQIYGHIKLPVIECTQIIRN